MIAKTSKLKIHGFEVTEFNYKVILPNKEQVHLGHDYPIDIDMEILEAEDNDKRYIVPMRIQVNHLEKAESGYQLNVFGLGTFEIDASSKLPPSTIQNLKFFSSVNIMISNLRGFLRDATSYGPLGAYNLPSIDMVDLVNKKKKAKN